MFSNFVYEMTPLFGRQGVGQNRWTERDPSEWKGKNKGWIHDQLKIKMYALKDACSLKCYYQILTLYKISI